MKILILSLLITRIGGQSNQVLNATAIDKNFAKQIVASAVAYTDSLYAYQSYRNGKWGIKNRKDRIVLSARFDSAGEIFNCKMPVIINGYQGITDTSGKITWLKKYKFVTSDWEPSGETFINGIGGGFIVVTNTAGKYGFINYNGVLTIPCRYTAAQQFSEGLSCVSGSNNTYGYINTTGEQVINYRYKTAYPFYNNRAAVLINAKIGFINRQGKVVIPAVYNQVFRFSEGLCAVTKSEYYDALFFIDTTGAKILSGPYDDATSFSNGKAVILRKGKCWQIDKTGKKIKYMGTNYFNGC